MTKKLFQKKCQYYLVYTALFTTVLITILWIYMAAGKSFVWEKDGLAQHYPALRYIHHYLRQLGDNLLQGELKMPMVDFRIGQGMDILTTLNYYGMGDPFLLLAAFCPLEHLETLYAVLIFLRLYLSGVFFSAFCFTKNHTRHSAVLTGALLYVFCGYGLYASVRHPFFVNGMLFLPLFLLGTERVLQKKKYGFFAIVAGWSMMTNFYFTYMNSILMGIYVLFRLVPDRGLLWKQKITQIFQMIGAYLIGIMMSAVVTFPVVYAYSGCSRGGEGGYSGSLLHYSWEFYLKFIGGFVYPAPSIGEWTNLSFTVIGAVCVLALFLHQPRKTGKKMQRKLLKTAFLLLTAMMMIPLAGKIMNGFGYVSNRWNFGYAMLIAYITVVMVPGLEDILALWMSRLISGMDLRFARKTAEKTVCLLMTGSLIFQANVLYTNGYNGSDTSYLDEFVERGKVDEMLQQTAADMVANTETSEKTEDFYRTEQPWYIGNQSIAMNYFGHNWYFSVVPQILSDFYNGFALNAMERTYSLRGLDCRTVLNELASTRYYVTSRAEDGLVPYGYRLARSKRNRVGVQQYLYQNDYALPLGYTTDRCIRKSLYETLGPVEKQEALMQGLVLEDRVCDSLKDSGIWVSERSDLRLDSREQEVTVTGQKGLEWKEDGTLQVNERNAELELTFPGVRDGETYLYLQGMQVKKSKPYQTCSVQSGDTSNYFVLMSREKSAWYNKPDITINLGYMKQRRKQCTITFPEKGIYQIDKISVITAPMKNYKEQVEKLAENTLTDLKVDSNLICGKIHLDRTKLLQLSIPYSRGWKIWVDGEERELLQTDGIYMGLALEPGDHSIRLEYVTPAYHAGFAGSAAGILCFGIMMWQQKRRRKC